MNNSMNSTSDSSNNSLNGFTYVFGVSIGVLVLISIATIASYFCARAQRPSATVATGQGSRDHDMAGDLIAVQLGLDDATISGYPKLLYSQARAHKGDSIGGSCSICLGDYVDEDMLRLLPDCGHVFHVKCVDPWLRLNPSCPVCRNSPAPTPLSTPLAEVAPLAAPRF